jgi:hypothetical protein
MPKYFYLIAAMFCLSVGVHAQSESNELDALYTPPKGSLFDIQAQKMKGDYSAKNILTVSPLLLARGQVAFGYQRALGSTGIALGAQLGFGVFRDFVHHIYVTDLSSASYFDIASPRDLNGVYQIGIFEDQGTTFQGSIKYYFDEGGKTEGKAWELSVRFGRESFVPNENYDPSSMYSNVSFNSRAPFDVRHTTLMLAWSETSTGSGKVSLVNHISVGAGVRFISYPYITGEEIQEAGGGFGFSTSAEFEISNTRTLSQIMPMIYIGWSIGAGW